MQTNKKTCQKKALGVFPSETMFGVKQYLNMDISLKNLFCLLA